MRRTWTGVSALALALHLLLVAGCDPGPAEFVPVRGRVYFRGAPLSTGSLVFIPDPLRGTKGSLGLADVQPDGSYVLRTGEREGGVIGWHRVTVAALDSPNPGGPVSEFAIPRSLIPDRYRDPELSGLSCEIKPGLENRIDLHLE